MCPLEGFYAPTANLQIVGTLMEGRWRFHVMCRVTVKHRFLEIFTVSYTLEESWF